MGKERIIIIGCGEQARVSIDAIEEQGKYEIVGLVTNDDADLHRKVYGYEVISTDRDVEHLLSERPDVTGYFLGVGIGTGSMQRRFELYTRFDALLQAVSVISSASVISRHSQIGKGVFIEAYARIANGVTVGNHCLIQSFTSINHDQTIHDNVLVGCNVSMAGTSIGSHTVIADGSSIGFK